jgi:diadenylate cyclase
MDIQKLLDLVKFNLPISEISKNPLFLVDILIVLLITYWIYKLLKNTKAVRILYGLLILVMMMYISSLLHLVLLNWVLGAILTIILVAIPVVFQPELRYALERIGRTGLRASSLTKSQEINILKPVLEAVRAMSLNRNGSIVAIQRNTGLGDYLKTGVALNSDISKELILSCFINTSPLHDGAMIISNDKILGASCIFPLSDSDLAAKLGTRHKAALGLSEQTDALIIVVSGTSGNISLAVEGELMKNISLEELQKKINYYFRELDLKKINFLPH